MTMLMTNHEETSESDFEFEPLPVAPFGAVLLDIHLIIAGATFRLGVDIRQQLSPAPGNSAYVALWPSP
jgi:hypothetical protein